MPRWERARAGIVRARVRRHAPSRERRVGRTSARGIAEHPEAGAGSGNSHPSRAARRATEEGGATSPSSEDDASGAEPAPMITAEDVELQSTRDTADVLRIYKVVRAIRNRGHFAARLDPLGRSLGPLKEGYELMESTVPEDGADIAKLLNGFPNDLYLRGRKVNVGQYLGLHDPPRRSAILPRQRQVSGPPTAGASGGRWRLMTRLRAVYAAP